MIATAPSEAFKRSFIELGDVGGNVLFLFRSRLDSLVLKIRS